MDMEAKKTKKKHVALFVSGSASRERERKRNDHVTYTDRKI